MLALSGHSSGTGASSEPTTLPASRAYSDRYQHNSTTIRKKFPNHRLLRRSSSDGETGQTVVGKARFVRGTKSASFRLRHQQPAHSIRDRGKVPPIKSECRG